MREILFRAKDNGVLNGVWQYGSLDISNPDAPTIIRIDRHNNKMFIPILIKTVGQYTGLTDKNGKKIFEGDIILFEDESPTNYEYHDCTEMRCGDVRFDDGEFYLTNRIAVEMGDLIYDGKLDGVIVGNIHDNPELLKSEGER